MTTAEATLCTMYLDRLARLRAVAHELREGGPLTASDQWVLKLAERGAFGTYQDCRDAGCGTEAAKMLGIGGKA